MKFSIIVPVHNAEKTILRCVNSLASQSGCDKEILLIENGSSDSSYEICRKLTEHQDQIRLFRTKKSGVSSARNIGLDHISGDIICFCDADDYYEQDVLAEIEEQFKRTDAAIIVTGYRTVSNSTEYKSRVKECDSILSASEFQCRVLNDVCVFGSVWNKFYRADDFKGVRFNEGIELCEDTYFNFCCTVSHPECKILYKAMITYNYVNNEQGLTNQRLDALFIDSKRLKYIDVCYRVLHDFDVSGDVEENVRYAIFGHAINFLHGNDLDQDKKNTLCKEVRGNFRSFLKLMWEYNPRYNVRRFVWLMEALPDIIRI